MLVYTCKSATTQSSLSSQVCRTLSPPAIWGPLLGAALPQIRRAFVSQRRQVPTPAHHPPGKDKHLPLASLSDERTIRTGETSRLPGPSMWVIIFVCDHPLPRAGCTQTPLYSYSISHVSTSFCPRHRMQGQSNPTHPAASCAHHAHSALPLILLTPEHEGSSRKKHSKTLQGERRHKKHLWLRSEQFRRAGQRAQQH